MSRTTLLLAALLCAAPALADDYALPSPLLTPGAVDTSQDVFCSRPSKERRHLRFGVTEEIARAYNVPRDDIGVRYQLDHLVPLSIGGATTAANLWPQPFPDADVKDICDRKVHILVCAGKVDAAEAAREIAADWPTACAKWLGR